MIEGNSIVTQPFLAIVTQIIEANRDTAFLRLGALGPESKNHGKIEN